jgi:hypothetical protein
MSGGNTFAAAATVTQAEALFFADPDTIVGKCV